jgi:hypothetical protein
VVTKVAAETFLRTIIQPACEAIGAWSEAAGQLLLGTAIQESGLVHRRQLGDGPALGLFQMEPATHHDCWVNYLVYRPDLAHKVLVVGSLTEPSDAEWLVGHDEYAAAMARVRYLRIDAKLPTVNDISAMADYWSKWYNTRDDAAKAQQFIDNWHRTMGES